MFKIKIVPDEVKQARKTFFNIRTIGDKAIAVRERD